MINYERLCRKHYVLFFLLFLISPVWGLGLAQSSHAGSGIAEATVAREDSLRWQEMTSVEDLHALYPERIQLVFDHLDLGREGLEKVTQAYESGNTLKAGKELLAYYRSSKGKEIVSGEAAPVSDKTVPAADSIVNDIITIQGVPDRVPRTEEGHLEWGHTGPADDMEYAWLHNRHSTVGTLLEAWKNTGNPRYARYIDHYIKDWIISSWPYPEVKSSTAMWRGLEVTGRVRNWMPAFFHLIDTGYLSPATQLLILSSLPEHAHYLRNFHAQGNWLTMEISGLATVAAYWPEFGKSSDWLAYSIDTMAASMKEQVYPDGVQAELTSHYHEVALRNFSQFVEICKSANVSLPDSYLETLEDMWHYLAATMRPDGHGILNNDSDLDDNRKGIKEAASRYQRQDWEYIASNGQMGMEPEGGPSFLFPWAGHLVSRSGYEEDAHWSFFDMGPWGIGHQHNDKLHLSVAAFGRDMLVDAGRFAYRGKVADRFREYAKSSASHNLVLIDGKGQGSGPERATEPVASDKVKITDDFDYASASFDHFNDLEGEAEHSRSLFYVRGAFWIVADHITTDRPRTIETLWHWHPEISVREKEQDIVLSDHPRGNLQVIPVGKTNGNIELIKGRDEPEVQGWYSREYNRYEPNTATIYSRRVESDDTFVWLLYPSREAAPKVEAEVLFQDADGVEVSVSVPGRGSWKVYVPFLNGGEARLEILADD